jgi:hypothetical protein
MYVFFLFTLHAPLLCSNTTCIVVTYLYSSLPFLFIVWLLNTLFFIQHYIVCELYVCVCVCM